MLNEALLAKRSCIRYWCNYHTLSPNQLMSVYYNRDSCVDWFCSSQFQSSMNVNGCASSQQPFFFCIADIIVPPIASEYSMHKMRMREKQKWRTRTSESERLKGAAQNDVYTETVIFICSLRMALMVRLLTRPSSNIQFNGIYHNRMNVSSHHIIKWQPIAE